MANPSGRIVLANIDGPIPVPAEESSYLPADGMVQANLRHFSSYGEEVNESNYESGMARDFVLSRMGSSMASGPA